MGSEEINSKWKHKWATLRISICATKTAVSHPHSILLYFLTVGCLKLVFWFENIQSTYNVKDDIKSFIDFQSFLCREHINSFSVDCWHEYKVIWAGFPPFNFLVSEWKLIFIFFPDEFFQMHNLLTQNLWWILCRKLLLLPAVQKNPCYVSHSVT